MVKVFRNHDTSENAIEFLRATINRLRQKLEADPAHPRDIAAEPGVEYRLRIEVVDAA